MAAAVTGPSTGGNMKLYRNTGSAGTPVWGLIQDIGDVNISELTRGLAELKRRSSPYVSNLAALIQSISIEFNIIHGMDTAVFGALRAMFFAGTAEEWAVMDQAIALSGAQGLRCPVVIEQFPWAQPLEEVSDHAIVAKTAYWESPVGVSINPSWYTVP